MELIEVIDKNLNVEEKETWKIKDDLTADWALERVRERAAEHKRLVEVAEARKLQLEKVIEDERKRYENETSFFKSKLAEYFETVSPRETKTQLSYRLPTGTLKLKKEKVSIKHDKDKLVQLLEREYPEFVKVQKAPNWAEFKKMLAVEGNSIVNKETGELMDCEGLQVEVKPAEFDVEVE